MKPEFSTCLEEMFQIHSIARFSLGVCGQSGSEILQPLAMNISCAASPSKMSPLDSWKENRRLEQGIHSKLEVMNHLDRGPR